MSEDEFELRDISPEPGGGDERLEESAADVASIVGAAAGVGAFGLGAAQAYYARATYRLQRDAAAEYEPGLADQDHYAPGLSEQVAPVLDLAVEDDPPYGRGGQECYPDFEDLDY